MHLNSQKLALRNASDAPSFTEKELRICNIMKSESLTANQIQQLSPHSSQYIIPHKQKNSKGYALILFSSASRQGAVAEADDLEQALMTSGCDVIKMVWNRATELQCMIAADCSLLIVCLMSHGCRGVLRASDGEEIPVNNTLHQFSYTLPEYIPLVNMHKSFRHSPKFDLLICRPSYMLSLHSS